MAKPASSQLQHHQAPWPLRTVVLVIAGVSLAFWAALFVAVF